MSIEVTMRHSDVRIEALKEYAEKRMARLKQRFPKVTSASIVIDVDAKKHMYMAEVVANRLGEARISRGRKAPVFLPADDAHIRVFFAICRCNPSRIVAAAVVHQQDLAVLKPSGARQTCPDILFYMIKRDHNAEQHVLPPILSPCETEGFMR